MEQLRLIEDLLPKRKPIASKAITVVREREAAPLKKETLRPSETKEPHRPDIDAMWVPGGAAHYR